MSFNLLLLIACLFAQLKELLAHVNGAVKLTLCLMDHTDLLVALCLDVAVLSSLGDIETLFEELE